MGYSVPRIDRMLPGRRQSGILSCEGHTQEEFRFCVHIVFLHFNFLVHILKSRCYVYDVFAIVHTPLSCNVFGYFTAWFIAVDA